MSTVEETASGQYLARLGILTTVCLWALQFPLVHRLAENWDPYSITALRYPLAAVILFAAQAMFFRGPLPPTPLAFHRKALLGASMALFGVLFTVGLAIGDPVSTAILSAVAPVTASLVAWLVRGDMPSRGVIVALFLVVPGALLATVDFAGETPRDAQDALGAFLVFLAGVSWSWYSLKAQDWLAGLPQVALTARSVLWCCPFVVLTFLVAHGLGVTYWDYQTAPVQDLQIFLIVTLGPMVVGVMFWNLSVSRLGLTVTALHLNLIPVIAMLIAYTQGSVPDLRQVVGMALVIAGVTIGQLSGRVRR